MDVRICTPQDIGTLARMNRLLIEDECAENTMTLHQLEQRMAGWLATDYRAFSFETEGRTVGYALVDSSKQPLYLRQFFICREKRRKGYGTRAFHALLDHLQTDPIEIDVYAWNHTGIAFWRSLGFAERVHRMRYTSE